MPPRKERTMSASKFRVNIVTPPEEIMPEQLCYIVFGMSISQFAKKLAADKDFMQRYGTPKEAVTV